MNRVSRYCRLLLLAFVCTPAIGEESETGNNTDTSLTERFLAGDRARARDRLLGAGLEQSDAERIADRLIADLRVCNSDVLSLIERKAQFSLLEGFMILSHCRAAAYERAGIPVPVGHEDTTIS